MGDIAKPLTYSALSSIFPPESDYSQDYSWAAIVGVVLLGFGQEPRIKQLSETLLQQTKGDKEAQKIAFRKLREALLKSSPLVGFPRSINGLAVLRKFLHYSSPDFAKSLESDKSLRAPIPLGERRKRGKEFFSKIYAQHTDRVLENLNGSSGGDLGEFAINCIYGDLMAETSILSAKETGMLEFVCCMTLAATPQAKGHMYGAHNLGSNGAEINAAVKIVETLAKELGMQWSDKGMDFLSKPKEKGW